MLAALGRRVSFSLLRDRPEHSVRRNVTMGPKHGVPLRIEHLR